jgi:phospholipid-binding lipoprotein MlaA
MYFSALPYIIGQITNVHKEKSYAPMSAIKARTRSLVAVTVMLLGAALSGCASNNPRDPLEPLNRGIYAFNDVVDNTIMKPIATGYQWLLPSMVRSGISNFFSNLDDITVLLNGLLQLKVPQALSDTGRLVINSTIGLLGFVDVATQLGLEKHNEDFGQTLGYWGIGSGPYLVLPFLGPSSVRDAVGRWVDAFSDVVWQEDHIRTRNQFYGTRAVGARAHLLDSEKIIDTAAIDRYSFLRDAYLQRRRNLVHDGNPPPEPDDEDLNNNNNKPRSEVPTAPAATLVDSRGNPVGSAHAEPASRSEHASPVPQPSPAADVSAAPAANTPANPPSPPATVAKDESAANENPGRIVRVWLQNAASQ